MENERIVLSSTHVDAHGDKISKEILFQIAETMNKEKYKPAVNIEHDLTLPPIGRCVNAEVIQGEDGEYYLTVERQFYDNRELITLDEGDILIKESFGKEQLPFKTRGLPDINGEVRISIDENSFEAKVTASTFFEELENECSLKFERGCYIRKSQFPDPIIIFELAPKIFFYFLSYKLISKFCGKLTEKLGEKVGDELIKFYDIVKKATIKMIKYSVPKNRPITYVFIIVNDIVLEYIIKTRNVDVVIEAFTKDKLNLLDEKIEKLKEVFDAEKIQFFFDEQKGWELNFLLTSKGDTIGTPIAYERRNKAFKKFIYNSRSELSIEGDAEREEPLK